MTDSTSPESIGCDGSVSWDTLGIMLENHATALREIVDSLPDALDGADATSKTLAIHAWLRVVYHPGLSLHQCPQAPDQPAASTSLAVCATGHDHYDGRTFTRREFLSGPPDQTPRHMLDWPALSKADAIAWEKSEETHENRAIWMARVATAEQTWFEHHPEALTARFQALGPQTDQLSEDGTELVFHEHAWEGLATYMKLPPLLRANLHPSHAMAPASSLDGSDPAHAMCSEHVNILLDGLPGHKEMPWLDRATFCVMLHPPSAQRLAQIQAQSLEGGTPDLDTPRRSPRL